MVAIMVLMKLHCIACQREYFCSASSGVQMEGVLQIAYFWENGVLGALLRHLKRYFWPLHRGVDGVATSAFAFGSRCVRADCRLQTAAFAVLFTTVFLIVSYSMPV